MSKEARHETSARGFDDLPEATATILDLLEKQLPDCTVFLVREDENSSNLRIADARGPDHGRIKSGFALPKAAPRKSVRGETQLDPMTSMLTGPLLEGMRSYVGIPLELSDGSRAGTLCAAAGTANRFEHSEIELLNVMARVIASEFERELTHSNLRRRHRDLLEHNKRLRVDASTDALTGVANRRCFEDHLAREWKLCQRGATVSYLMIIDLDDFKAVNDEYGHATGDAVLRELAQTLTEAGRDTDIVGRIGGDEFAVVLVGCAAAEAATIYRERARSLYSQNLAAQQAPNVAFSAGFHALVAATSPLRALELADQAMYWQKRQRAGRLPTLGELEMRVDGPRLRRQPLTPIDRYSDS